MEKQITFPVENYLKNEPLDLNATIPASGIYKDSDLAVIATPTNYDEETHSFKQARLKKVSKMLLMKIQIL